METTIFSECGSFFYRKAGTTVLLIQSYMGVLMDLEIIYSFATCFRFGVPVCMMGEILLIFFLRYGKDLNEISL